MTKDEAELHWIYTEKILLKMIEMCHICYVEAMIHGAKHEKEDKKVE